MMHSTLVFSTYLEFARIRRHFQRHQQAPQDMMERIRLMHTLKPSTIHPIEIENIIQDLTHHRQAPLQCLKLNILALPSCQCTQRTHVLDSEGSGVQRDADLVEDVGREATLGLCGLALVDLCFLGRFVLQFELVAQDVKTPLGVLAHVVHPHQEDMECD
jgi:hypothetical protein